MPKFIVENIERYEVEAESLEIALASFHVGFEGIEPDIFELTADQIIDTDTFEYLDGSLTAKEID